MNLQKDPLTINWGLEEEANLPLKSTSTGSVVQIGDREFIGITQHSLVRFETSVIIGYLPYQLSALVSIRDQQILVGVTSISSEFVVILLNDIKKPIYTKTKTNDASIFNMIYLPKSSLLITSGEDLKVWHLDYYHNNKSIIPTEPRLKIEYQRTIISEYQSSIMNPPIVDFQTEIIYIDDKNGSLQMYKASTGENIGCAIKCQTKSKTTIGYNNESKKFLASNADQGTILYNKSGSFNNRFLLSNVATLAIRFINKEYAILLDANNLLTILDIKTSRSFVCYKGEKPIKRIFLFNYPTPRLIICYNTKIVIFRIVLPWKFWKTTISSPLSMIRCPKYNEAARLLVMCSNSHLKLISPSQKVTLTAVTLSSLSSPFYNGYFYDRGTEKVKRDQLMLPLKDGQIQIFSTGENPCKLISSLEAKAICICLCRYKNKRCFVFGTSNGNLLFYDYETLTKVHRVVLAPFPIIKIFYCRTFSEDDDENEEEDDDDFDDSLCLVFEDQLVRYSIRDEKICESLKICGSEISLCFNDIILFGYENGEIGSVYFDKSDNCKLIEHITNGLKIHDDKITGLSLGLDSDYFASSSLDMSLRIWTTKEITLIKKIVFPVKLISVAILNGKRDIVVGTDNEIMFVNNELIFKGNVDEENEEFDNFDKKVDFLSSQFSLIGKENEEKEEESFLESRKNRTDNENSKKRKPVNKKIRKITEALKKHEEMINQKISQFNSNLEEENNKRSNKKSEIDPDERERLFNQMNEITNGKTKKVVVPKIEKQNKKEEEDLYEYEYYEYENDEMIDQNNETEKTNSSKSNKNDQNESIIIVKKNPIDIDSDSKESATSLNNENNDETELKIRMPSNKNGYRSPKRNIRRGYPRNQATPSTGINSNASNYDDYDYSQDLSDETSTNDNTTIANSNKSHNNNNLYGDNDKTRSKKKSKNNHQIKNHHSQNKHEIDNENENIQSTNKNKNKSKNNDHETRNRSNLGNKSNSKNPTANQDHSSHINDHSSIEHKSSSFQYNKSHDKNSIINQSQNTSSTNNHNTIDRRTRMNLFLVNHSIVDHLNSNSQSINFDRPNNHRNNSIEIRSQSSLHTSSQNQAQGQLLKIKATRRFPTPLGYHFVHPGLSLFERSIKPRRPKTPDKHNNGLIISRSVVPTNIILDASALDSIIESDDVRYRPLLNQIRPLLRSHYNYYSEKMRNLGRIHAYFNLNVMIPAYKRNRQQIQRFTNEIQRFTKSQENVVPPIKIDKLDHTEKPRNLIDIGKVSHSYDYKNAKSTRKRLNQMSPRIFKLNRNYSKRKESCPPRINKNVVLAPLPQTARNKNNQENNEYNDFISSLLCNQRDRRVIHKKQKSKSLAELPKDSLFVTGKLMMTNNQKHFKKE